MWEADTIGDASRFINLFRQRLADCFTQQWHPEVEESPKTLHYKHFKLILEIEPYLNIDLPFIYRKVLANFRCSSHSLMIEAGRHQNIDRNLRFCQMCLKRNVYIVEDEFHFFLVCPAFDDIRELYTGPRSAVGNVSGYRCEADCRSRGREFDPGLVPYFRGD